MAQLLLKNIRSDKKAALIVNTGAITKKELRAELDPLKKALLHDFRKIVKGWKSDVDFNARTFINVGFIAINAFPIGEDKEKWVYVDEGTPPHIITSKNKTLRFQSEYSPKTLAKPARVATGSGAGESSGKWISAQSVNHPGSTPRLFTVAISRDYKPFFRRRIEAAFKRVARKVNKK